MTWAGPVAIAGVALLALGGLGALVRPLLRPSLWAAAAGTALLGVAGGAVLADGSPVGAGWSQGVHLAFGIDGLTGFFLLALAVAAVPAVVYAQGYLAGTTGAGAVACLSACFLLALAGVLTARDVVSFLCLWELMTLLPAAAILVARHDRRTRHTVFAYVGITHLGTVGVWIAMLLLARSGALGDPTALAAQGTAVQTAVALAAVVGFGTKAGLMPAHSWLPRAHPVAPSHVSAVMSGLMVKVALYGLIRVCLEWLGASPLWLGLLLLFLGGLSALGGVLYAIFQRDLKRLLAFSTIENVGIVVLALGASVLFAERGSGEWRAVAFGAALLHVLNHSVFKSLLFLGAGSFEKRVHGLELDRLGGLLRRMPWTGAAFLVGAAAIAGVPPLNGFASEWVTLQSLLHLAPGGGLGVGLAGGLATFVLGLAAALAVLAFVKASGLVLLGPPRRQAVAEAEEVGWSMRGPVVALAGACVALGALPGLVLPRLEELSPGAAAVPSSVTVAIPGTGSLPALWLMLGLVGATGALVLARGRRKAAPAPAWACGQLVGPELRWTSAGFSKTLRLTLEAVLRPERSVHLRRSGGVVQGLDYRSDVPHLFDTHVFDPIVRASLAAARVARSLQSGSLRAYVAYLGGLVVLLLVLARAGAFS